MTDKKIKRRSLRTLKGFKQYLLGTSGAIAIAFALMAPVVVGSAGMALDFAQAYLVQQRLAQALDAAALAAAGSSTEEAAIQQKVQDFFDINYPPEKLGITFTPVVSVDGERITVTGDAQYITFFLRLIGIDEIDVDAKTEVTREVQGLEVVLVLDNTGSMSRNNNIQALRDASESFVNILFSRTADPESIKIGLVPYSSSVNVGPYGLGLDPDGLVYNNGTVFVDLPYGTTYTTNYYTRNQDEWLGCVLAYNEDGYDEDYDSNDSYPADIQDLHTGPWEPYKFERYGRIDGVFQYYDYRYPNYHCPQTPVVPLSSDQDKLLESIDTMVARGYTLGNYGMMWGERLISPQEPFTEGVSYDDLYWRKAIVMMTDGVNTMQRDYTAYWKTRNHDITPGDLNDRFAEVCQALKEKGVVIYTVTFTSGVSASTKQFYEDCASSEDQYYDAPSQEDLIEVFEQISRELSNLHISY